VTNLEYARTRRYERAVLQHGERPATPTRQLVLQERDLDVLYDAWRYRFVTSDQLRELHWPHTRDPRTAQIRLRLLFDCGYLERLRPYPQRREGSYPWTYALGAAGYEVLVRSGRLDRRVRYRPPGVLDYGRIVHDVQLNSWVLALKKVVGNGLVTWHGEREALVAPSREARAGQLQVVNEWIPRDVDGAQPVRPDALLEVALPGGGTGHLLIELDRTERPDKNFEKFRRYDSFLTAWGGESRFGEEAFVVFVCANDEVLRQFVATAEIELCGYLAYPGVSPREYVYVGRQRTLFAAEPAIYGGSLDAWQLPHVPRAVEPRSAPTMLPVALPCR
jgi:hypothetical protein